MVIYDRDNGCKTHRAKRSCLIQARDKADSEKHCLHRTRRQEVDRPVKRLELGKMLKESPD
jgi:hypothetical protein